MDITEIAADLCHIRFKVNCFEEFRKSICMTAKTAAAFMFLSILSDDKCNAEDCGNESILL